MNDFKPGLYKHYKGGLYTAICLGTHHETRQPVVIYISHTYGGLNVRPLHGWLGDVDGWDDIIKISDNEAVRRFQFVGDLPSDIPMGERNLFT
jgi:hypothetical protein